MVNSTFKRMLGLTPIALAMLVVAGCYTQLRVETSRSAAAIEPPPAHAAIDSLSLTTEFPWHNAPPSGRWVTIGAKFTNNSDVPVLLRGCPHPPSVAVDQWDGSRWQEKFTQGIWCLAMYSTKTVKLEPGDSFEFELHIQYPGWYRIRLLVGPDTSHPDAVVHSNQFLIRRP
jgi:hypothetical protein